MKDFASIFARKKEQKLPALADGISAICVTWYSTVFYLFPANTHNGLFFHRARIRVKSAWPYEWWIFSSSKRLFRHRIRSALDSKNKCQASRFDRILCRNCLAFHVNEPFMSIKKNNQSFCVHLNLSAWMSHRITRLKPKHNSIQPAVVSKASESKVSACGFCFMNHTSCCKLQFGTP